MAASHDAAIAANRLAWDACAPLHGEGPEWDALLQAAGQPGFCELDNNLKHTLQSLNVQGLRAAQVGCNNGRELLSLATLGALPVLGIDQSGAFLAQAQRLSQARDLHPRWLQADIHQLPADVGPVDLVIITIGVLNWMPDLHRFMAAVARLMAPGARLVINETHPMLEMFDPESATPFEPTLSYFDKGPHIFTQAITYDGSDGGQAPPAHWFVHTLGDVVSACVANGLQVQRLTEHPDLNREAEYEVYARRAAQLPLSYTLVAQRT